MLNLLCLATILLTWLPEIPDNSGWTFHSIGTFEYYPPKHLKFLGLLYLNSPQKSAGNNLVWITKLFLKNYNMESNSLEIHRDP